MHLHQFYLLLYILPQLRVYTWVYRTPVTLTIPTCNTRGGPWFVVLLTFDLGCWTAWLTYKSLTLFSSCKGDITWFGSFRGSRAGLVHLEVAWAGLAHLEVVWADLPHLAVVWLDLVHFGMAWADSTHLEVVSICMEWLVHLSTQQTSR